MNTNKRRWHLKWIFSALDAETNPLAKQKEKYILLSRVKHVYFVKRMLTLCREMPWDAPESN